MLIGLHEAIPVSPACRQGSRSTSPQLSTYQRRCPITVVRGKPQGRDSILNFVFKGRPRSRLMRHWRRRPARLQRFLRNIKQTRLALRIAAVTMAICTAASPPNACCSQRNLGMIQPWENRRDPPARLLVSAARTSLQQVADTKFSSPKEVGLVSTIQHIAGQNPPIVASPPRPTAGRQPAARRGWLCVGRRSCHHNGTTANPNSDLNSG
jgi:hypothetical protein